ncbi:hypothetical protein KC722_00325 [Candidatus Kaiserbacteria bacterium]|nr:hypothetical protein [Candidatus Kaiserbacteria bacterium]MCB9811959.1 hypothetical protein [Candidatus Nomurabacteria bacterium]
MDQIEIQQLLDTDMTKVYGIDDMEPQEREAFFTSLGMTLLDATLLRMAGKLSPQQVEALEQYMETNPEPLAALQHLDEHYPLFRQILQEEVVAFKEEAAAVLGLAAADEAK